MDTTIFKILIQEKQDEISKIRLIRRKLNFDPECNYVLVGVRRAGKSYALFQHIQDLVESQQATWTNILYINFEDDRLAGITVADLHLVLDAFKELFDTQPLIFLDEIQIVAGWEKFARRLADSGYRVFITGSNAQMLSREIYSTLGARFNVHEIYPFSFGEFLKYKEIELSGNWETSPLRFEIRRHFAEFFTFGGFAQSFAMQNRREWTNSILQKVLLGDIAARHDIRNTGALQLLCRKLAESVLQPVSQTRLCHVLASAGENVARASVSNWLRFMEDAYLIFSLPNFSGSFSERAGTQKRYFSDNAFLSNFLVEPQAKLLENLVALTLRKSVPSDGLFFYKKNIEIDFYLPEEKTAIQACLSLADDATRERETRALVSFAKAFGAEKLVVVTLDTEKKITRNGFEIEVVPAWKWVLRREALARENAAGTSGNAASEKLTNTNAA